MKIQKYFLLQNKKIKSWLKYWLFIKSKVVKYKNLLPNFAVSTTINTLDFTVNEDKSITVNGTSTGTTNFTLVGSSGVATEILKLNANQDYYNTTSIRLVYRLVGGDYGAINSGYFKPTNDLSIRHIYLSIPAGTYNNVTYYPQIVEGNKALPYVPYEEG